LEKISINTSTSKSDIYVGENWDTAFSFLPAKGTVIITDDNVNRLYGKRFPGIPVFSIKSGEASKDLETIQILAEKLLEAGIDRTGFILAIGGGVVCDIAGFLASVYMRGIRTGYISTTLLSQVDASTGGKNGVNLGGTKNMIGTIRQPEFVICDPSMLQTLPEQEYLSGLAELIKTAIIGDKELFAMIENRSEDILFRNPDLLSILVAKSVKLKCLVVAEDEMETGLRRILNFGHTFGHAIEMHDGLKHGIAVASGMVLATEFSFEKGLISHEEKQRIINLLKRYDLINKIDISTDQIEKLVLHDKKKTGAEINFVFIEGIGNAKIEKITVSAMLGFYKRFIEKKQ
jgi:3-dehydroquinate synthase